MARGPKSAKRAPKQAAPPKKGRGKPMAELRDLSESEEELSDDFAAGKGRIDFDAGEGRDSEDELEEEAVYQLDDDDEEEDDSDDEIDVVDEAMEAGGKIGRREQWEGCGVCAAAWGGIRRGPGSLHAPGPCKAQLRAATRSCSC